MPTQTLNELNSKLRAEFPDEMLAQWKIGFSGFKASNPLSALLENNPLKWKMCAAQFYVYDPRGSAVAYQVTITMTEPVLLDTANLDKIIGMCDLNMQYLKHMLAAAEVLARQ